MTKVFLFKISLLGGVPFEAGLIHLSTNAVAIIIKGEIKTICHKDCITSMKFIERTKDYVNIDKSKYQDVIDAIENDII
jgi:hypothetical protein